ncbi:MAG: hypothetical protein ACR2JJ_11750 [Sphingomicrobium sp.]
MIQAKSVLADPNWFPYRLDLSRDAIQFVKIDRQAHHSTTFLDEQVLALAQDEIVLQLDEIERSREAAAPADCHFIFHSAFCCSTLIARALDIPGTAMALKEPLPLSDLGQAALAAGNPTRFDRPLSVLLDLFARPFSPDEKVIVKPGNVANPLIDSILRLRPDARALFVYSPLPGFLTSVAKKGLWGRGWARRLFASLRRIPEFDAGFSEQDLWEQTDLQIAALAWLHHQAQFARLLKQQPPCRIASLMSSTLLERPADALAGIGRLFSLELDEENWKAIAEGPVFATDSKRHHEPNDPGRRLSEHAAAGDAYGEEISMVVQWTHEVAAHTGVPICLPSSLL